jgi:predicted O-methyltransferase YrrM
VNKLYSILKYIQYQTKAQNLHGLHSPFVYELTEQVIYNEMQYYCYDKIEGIRQNLLNDKRTCACIELGAGSYANKKQVKAVKQIASTALKSAKYSQLLFRLSNYFQPKTILEIGTSLGVTTSYMASASRNSLVITLEGCEDVLEIAKQNFDDLKLNNVKSVLGNFNETLPKILSQEQNLDFVFFDGNHKYEPTIRYFNWCKEKAAAESVFVFDDIYWSKEMGKAWEEIKNHPDVMISLDLYYLGIVFFKKQLVKQHFVIRY